MVDKFIQVPTNIEDPVILKRFITELVDKLNSNASIAYPILYPTGYSGYIPDYYTQDIGNYTNTILEAAAKLDTLSGEAKNYLTDGLSTQVLANSADIANITTQFGTFYDNTTAAAWYGLTVKTGELISGFTVGGVDSDTTTPGTAGSFFTINADTFSVGRAIEDINDPTELAYVQANNLPYGTMYDATTQSIVPAFLIDWNGVGYDIFFNGKTSFNSYLSPGTTTINGASITTGSISANQLSANSVTTSKIAIGVGIINGYVQSSDFTTIGGAGFRLKSNAAGTSADPTIYGAYVKGGVIDGATLTGEVLSVNNMKFNDSNYPSNTANVLVYGNSTAYNAYFTGTIYSNTTTFISSSNGSGFAANRIVASSKKFIFNFSVSSDSSAISCTIQCSIDGGGWATLHTQSIGNYKYYSSLSFSSTISFRTSATIPAGYHNGTANVDIECYNFNFS